VSAVRSVVAVLIACAVAFAPEAAAQDCLDPDTPDCDGDGFAPPDDCDDDDAAVNEDAAELCNNSTDDDCDGVVDDDCYDAFQTGTLEGGSTCEGNDGGWAALLLFPGLFARRRRR
jgi:hypothetical protein